MNRINNKLVILLFGLFSGCFSGVNQSVSPLPEMIKSYDIDFNWGEGGPNAFAAPGLWADADPQEHIKWYEALGCNVVQTFAVSCNGYAWYKNGIIPEQPGLKYDFLTEMVKLGHQRNMKIFGYFCAGANTKWGTDHPDLSYGIPSNPHIPFTTPYLDYLCASIKDALEKTKMDGFMIDWIWNPGATMEPYPSLRWLACEQEMFVELMNRPFPGVDNITPELEKEFRRKAIARCWRRIHDTAMETNPNCMIWVTCCQVTSSDLVDSDMFKEADIFMNEEGDVTHVEGIRNKVGEHTRLLTCLANWNQQDPAVIIPQAIKANIGLFGFTKPHANSLLPPVSYYLSKPVDEFERDDRNIAYFARIYNNLALDYVKTD
jgi:hypothetical protein